MVQICIIQFHPSPPAKQVYERAVNAHDYKEHEYILVYLQSNQRAILTLFPKKAKKMCLILLTIGRFMF